MLFSTEGHASMQRATGGMAAAGDGDDGDDAGGARLPRSHARCRVDRPELT